MNDVWALHAKKCMNVTMDHVVQACDWAMKKGKEQEPLKGLEYDQGIWAGSDHSDEDDFYDKAPACGTRCCIWGAAFIIANGIAAFSGPSHTWKDQSSLHRKMARLFQETEDTGELCSDDEGDQEFLSMVKKEALGLGDE